MLTRPYIWLILVGGTTLFRGLGGPLLAQVFSDQELNFASQATSVRFRENEINSQLPGVEVGALQIHPAHSAQVRDAIDQHAANIVRAYDRLYDLSEDQQRKLHVAAQLDLQRLLRRLAVLRASAEHPPDENQMVHVRQGLFIVGGLSIDKDPLGPGSTFAKIYERLVSQEQLAAAEQRKASLLQAWSVDASWMELVVWMTKNWKISKGQWSRLNHLLLPDTSPNRATARKLIERLSATERAELQTILSDEQLAKVYKLIGY